MELCRSSWKDDTEDWFIRILQWGPKMLRTLVRHQKRRIHEDCRHELDPAGHRQGCVEEIREVLQPAMDESRLNEKERCVCVNYTRIV